MFLMGFHTQGPMKFTYVYQVLIIYIIVQVQNIENSPKFKLLYTINIRPKSDFYRFLIGKIHNILTEKSRASSKLNLYSY